MEWHDILVFHARVGNGKHTYVLIPFAVKFSYGGSLSISERLSVMLTYDSLSMHHLSSYIVILWVKWWTLNIPVVDN